MKNNQIPDSQCFYIPHHQSHGLIPEGWTPCDSSRPRWVGSVKLWKPATKISGGNVAVKPLKERGDMNGIDL